MYKVSILVPIYGVEQYIERCARSLFEQTYQNLEYVFVNDCSPDRSLELLLNVITDYPQRKDAVRIVSHEKNRGLAAARNTALEYATGVFISHVDSDDWVDPQMIECLVSRQLETDADIVSCDALIHGSDGERYLEESDYGSKDEMMRRILQLSMDHVIWRRLIRLSLYKANDIHLVEGANIGEDHYTLPRLLFYADSFARCKRVLYHYNCLNEHSYMQSTDEAFNFIRYKSNITSFNILTDFFRPRSSYYSDYLCALKSAYVYKQFFIVLKAGNKDGYKELCKDWKSMDRVFLKEAADCKSDFRIRLLSPSFYWLNRLRVISKVILNKVFGIRRYEL